MTTKTDPDISPEPVRGETAMSVRQQGGIQLANWEDLRSFASAVVKSGQYKNWTSTPQVAITIQTGAELGFSPIRSLAAFYTPPGGKPKLMGEAALALIRASKVCSRGPKVGNEGEGDQRCGYIKFVRGDDPDEELIVERYTMADATVVGLDKKWIKAREKGGKATNDEMLVWRAVARASTRHFSDVMMGVMIGDPSDIPVSAPASSVRTAEAEIQAVAESETPDPLLEGAEEEPEAIDADEVPEEPGAPEAPESDAPEETPTETPEASSDEPDPSSGCPGCASPATPKNGNCPDCNFPDNEEEQP